MKFSSALLVSSVTAGAIAGQAPHRGRHARFHDKRAALPTQAEMVAELQKRALDDPTLAKRCGEMIYATYPGNGAPISFPNCFGPCANACGSSSNNNAAAPAAPAPPAPPASTPAPPPASSPAAVPAAPASSPASQAHDQNDGSSSSSSSSSNSGAASGGKKGLAYNEASLITATWLKGGVSWAYNWASTGSGLLSGIEFIPMMWGLASADGFASAVSGVDKSTPLLSFNEPDMGTDVGGSSIDPATAAQKHQEIMAPLRQAGHPIGAPAVSSSNAGNQGLAWLASFAQACGSDCAVDFCPLHWYGWNADASQQADAFKKYVQQGIDACHQHFPGKPVWFTEFAASGPNGGIKDPAVNADFLKIVAPWMDSNNDVERYSPFMVGDGEALGGLIPSAAGLALIAA